MKSKIYISLTKYASWIPFAIFGLIISSPILFGFFVGIISSAIEINSSSCDFTSGFWEFSFCRIFEIFMSGFMTAAMAIMPIGAFCLGLFILCGFVYMFFRVVSEFFIKETDENSERIGFVNLLIASPFGIGLSWFLLWFSINNYESFYSLIWNDFQKIIN